MRTVLIPGLVCRSSLLLFAADTNAQAEVRGAIQQLASQPNYSWTATPKAEGNAPLIRQGPTIGEVEQNGFTYFRFTLEGNPVQVALKAEKSAIKTEAAWESAKELPEDRRWIVRRLEGFKAPAAEAEDLLRICRTVRSEKGGSFAGDLTPNGVKALLLSRSRDDFSARVSPGAKGSVKFWIKNGMLAKYEYSLQGKITLTDHQQEFAINRTITVEITKIGSTKIQIPEEAKKKLG